MTLTEATTTQDLLYMAAADHDTLKAVLSLQWTQDSITPPEAKAISGLRALAHRDADITKMITAMPFLESVAEEDALLIDAPHSAWHRNTLNDFVTHPTIADGITDTETIRAVAATTINDTAQIHRLLNPGSAIVETIQTSTPRTPDLNISVVRAGTRRATDTSILVEEAVGYVEDFMNLPLPTNHVILLLDDTGVTTGFAGVNYGQAIAYLRKGEDGTEWERAAFRKGMVHEVAHYFWRGAENWLDEGMAELIEHNYALETGLPPAMVQSKKGSCTLKTLAQLSALDLPHSHPEHRCNYHLGSALFIDLQTELGPTQFKLGAQQLYRLLEILYVRDDKAGIKEVEAAFPQNKHISATHWNGIAIPPPTAAATPTTTPPWHPSPTLAPLDRKPKTRPTAAPPPTTAPPAAPRTATPLPMANVTRTPEATPSPTGGPLPTTAPPRPPRPIATATPWPTATPEPTATAIPTPTPVPPWKHHTSDELDYAIRRPYTWTPSGTSTSESFTDTNNPSNYLTVTSHPFNADWSIARFTDDYRQQQLVEARTWHHYREISAAGKFRGATNYIELHFERQIGPQDCVQDTITHLYRSRFFPKELSGFSVTIAVCADDLHKLSSKRQTILDSFAETNPPD